MECGQITYLLITLAYMYGIFWHFKIIYKVAQETLQEKQFINSLALNLSISILVVILSVCWPVIFIHSMFSDQLDEK